MLGRHIVWKQVQEKGGCVDDVAEVQVHRFGSVPLKTYLPHGDLDVTAFAPDDKWLSKVQLQVGQKITPCGPSHD